MRPITLFVLALTLFPILPDNVSARRVTRADTHGSLDALMGRVQFARNEGQADRDVRFAARLGSGDVQLTPTGARFTSGSDDTVRLEFRGARSSVRVEGEQRLPSTLSYFVGRDPSRWAHDVPEFASVRYSGLYPGVDAVFYGRGGEVEYDFILEPGKSPSVLRLGVIGAMHVEIDGTGSLVASTAWGSVRQAAPVSYQVVDGQRRSVPSRFVQLHEDEFGFEVEAYDASLPLVIDPTIEFSTYFGGPQNFAHDIAVDREGNAYVVGRALVANFPATIDQTTTPDRAPSFLYKVSPQGNLIYAIAFGGNFAEDAWAVAVDEDGNPVVGGATNSTDFPLVRPFQSVKGASYTGFIIKFSADGHSVLFSTYYGGTGNSGVDALATGPNGIIYAAGSAEDGLLLRNAVDTSQAKADLFVAKLDTEGNRAIYSTYLGGSEDEGWASIAVDGQGSAYLFGSTRSTDFPTAAPYQASNRGGADNVLAKFSPEGQFVYSTYFGGDAFEGAYGGVAVDPDGSAVVLGNTNSWNLPLMNPLFGTLPGGGTLDGYIAKFNPAGSALVFSTYIGGSAGHEEANDVEVDEAGTIWATGQTASPDFPMKNALPVAQETGHLGWGNAFVVRLSRDGQKLLLSTYVGASNFDRGMGLASPGGGRVWVTGDTFSPDFPLVRPIQTQPPPFDSGTTFLSLIDASTADLRVTVTPATETAVSGGQFRFTVTAVNYGPDAARNVALSTSTPEGTTLVNAIASSGALSAPQPGGTGTIRVDSESVPSGELLSITVTVQVALQSGAQLEMSGAATSQTADEDGASATAAVTVVPAVDPPVISEVRGERRPGKLYRLRIVGSNFQPGARLLLGEGGGAWPTKAKGTTVLLTIGGVKASLPKGVPVLLTVENPDGGSATYTFTR